MTAEALDEPDDRGVVMAFAEADGLGYLEADPELDVGGIDAGHKLSLLAAIAFIGIDAYLGSDICYIAGREFLSFLEWLAFWR